MRWFSTCILGIIPLERNVKGARTDPLKGIVDAIGRQGTKQFKIVLQRLAETKARIA